MLHMEWICTTAEDTELGESIADGANSKQACFFSTGNIALSFKITTYMRKPDKWLG